MNKTAKIIGIGLSTIILVLAVLFLGFSLKTSVADYSLLEKYPVYTQDINLTFNQNTSYIFVPEKQGKVSSFGITGYLKGDSANIQLDENLVYSYGFNNVSSVITSSGSGEINLSFDYGSGAGYDNNNDGISYIYDIIDFNINAGFTFDADYSKLCTKYSINNLDENLTNSICYGSIDCCLFLNLESKGNWNDSLYLNYNKDSAGKNNTVSAQIIYYDVNLSEENLHSNIYNSEEKELKAIFTEAVYFDSNCENCGIVLDSNNTLDISVDGLLHIYNISYSFVDLNKTILDVIDSKLENNIWRTSVSAIGKNDFEIYFTNSSNFIFNNIYCNDSLVNASVVLEDDRVIPLDVYQKIARIHEIDEALR